MTKAIYKVTSKKMTEVILKELKRKQKYIPKITRQVKKVMPGILAVTSYESSWDGTLVPRGLVLDPVELTKLDLKKWKKLDRVEYKNKMVYSYWPKVNTKVGKELAAKLTAAMPSETFFQDKELAELLKYNPKSKTQGVSPNRISVNILGFGYKKVKKDYTFMFQAYEGYKAPRGVKEMLTSEYNRLMK